MIEAWQFYNPVRMVAGAGSLDRLPDLLTGDEWLLVTTKGFSRRGLTNRLRGLVPEVTLTVDDSVTPNPELDYLEEATRKHRARPFAGIIALGGGSVMDAAKVLAVTIPSDLKGPLNSVLRQGETHDWKEKLPLIAIPTTSGTGSEVTPFATVWDQTQYKKYSVTGDKIFPNAALYDPELTLTLPEKDTLYTGLDAVSHSLESLWNKNRSPVSVAYAVHSLRLTIRALPAVLADLSDLRARTDMQLASMFSGLAISQTRTAIAHSISYPLTSHYGVPHGLACSFTLPRIIEHYMPAEQDKMLAGLMSEAKNMLENMDLFSYVYKYVTPEQIHALKSDMYHPDRVGNFNGDLTGDTVDNLLRHR